jgi:receptor protein-tyrosine kinase
MNDPSLSPFLMIRSTIEAEVAAPGVLAVSSALAGDGKTGVTAGIARSLAAAGYRTLAIDAASQSPNATTVDAAVALIADTPRPVEAGCDFIAIAPGQARVASATAIAAFYASIREHYDYAIVDAAAIGNGGLAFARNADGVVLALRDGRAATDADRDTVALFTRLNVRFLGVVATHAERGRNAPAPKSLYERLEPRPERGAALVEDTPIRGAAFGAAPAAGRSAV